MQFYQKRTVEEQANRLPYELREAYKNSQIDRITISANGKTVELTGYAEYSYHEEKSYKTQPVRTIDGKIAEIDEYETFLTPRLIIKYNMMGIDDYRETMKLLKSSNSFVVRCYDPVENKIVVNEMYFAPTAMPIIYQQYLISLGIQEFSIELIGTNKTNDFSIRFDDAQFFGEFSAPIESTWNDFIPTIDGNPILYVASDIVYANFHDDEARLFYNSGLIVRASDKIIDGEKYYIARN